MGEYSVSGGHTMPICLTAMLSIAFIDWVISIDDVLRTSGLDISHLRSSQ